MAITLVGSNSTNITTGTDISLTHGITIQSGDIVEALVHSNVAGAAISDDNGANSFTDQFQRDGASSNRLAIFTRVAGGSEPTSYAFTHGGSNACSLMIRVWRGVNTSSLFDVAPLHANSASGASASSFVAPTITTSNDGSLARCAVFNDIGTLNYSGINNGFTGFVTEDNRSQANGYKVITTAGAVGATTISLGSGSDDYYTLQWAYNEASAAALTLDSVPTDVNSQTQESSQVSTPATTPTTGNTEVKWDNDSGVAATVNSVTGSDPYTINFTFDRTAAKLFNSTGYPLYHEVDAENVTSAGNVPYLPVSGQDFIDLSSPVDTAGTLGETYAGSATATGDQWVHDTTLTGDATVTMDVDDQGYWILSGTPSATSTADFYRIDSTGTVDVEDTISFEPAPDAVIPSANRASINKIADALRDAETYTHSQTNDLVVEWLVSEGISRTALNQMLYGYLGGLGYTGTLQDRMIAWSKDS